MGYVFALVCGIIFGMWWASTASDDKNPSEELAKKIKKSADGIKNGFKHKE